MHPLAIVIPYYNIRFFKDTLQSLADQENKNFIVYIGNDNSPQDPLALIGEYSERLSIVYKKFDRNMGAQSLTGQWQRCLELADLSSTHWFMILGDDDVLAPDCIREFYEHLPEIAAREVKVVKFATMRMDNEANSTSKRYTHPVLEQSTDAFMRKLRFESRGSLSEQIFSYPSYMRHGIPEYPLAWHSDDMMNLLLSDFGTIYSLNDATVYIREGSNSISGKSDNLHTKEKASMLFYTDLLEKYRHHFHTEDLITVFERLSDIHIRDKKLRDLDKLKAVGKLNFPSAVVSAQIRKVRIQIVKNRIKKIMQKH